MVEPAPHSPETTLAVILGASEFPKAPKLTAADAFKNSSRRLRQYLTSKEGLALPQENVLDLFDAEKAPADLDEEVATFLKKRLAELKAEGHVARDLIVYYVGHGGFSGDNEYFLALRSTRSDNEAMSSYPIKGLAKTLREHAARLRRIVILDSCFSAAAYDAFQSAPLEVAKQKTLSELPSRGTALLCASGPRDPAKVLPGQDYTMFSDSLLEALERGDAGGPQELSIAEVGTLTQQLIRERYTDEAVRPEVHSPSQKHGDVAALPFFPNAALRGDPLEERLVAVETACKQSRADIADLDRRFVGIAESVRELQGVLSELQSKVPEGELEHAPVGTEVDPLELAPGSVKAEVDRFVSAQRFGRAWVAIAAGISAGGILDLLTVQYYLVSQLMILMSFIFMIFSLRGVTAPKLMAKHGDTMPPGWAAQPQDAPWDDLEIVVRARNTPISVVLPGLYMSSGLASVAFVISLTSFVAMVGLRFLPWSW